MSILYERIMELCEAKNITAYRMCKEIGIQPSIITDLKKGRKKTVQAETASKIAGYFGVSSDYLLGKDDAGSEPERAKEITDEDIKFALFGGDVTDEAYEDVKRFAQFIKEKYEKGGKDQGSK